MSRNTGLGILSAIAIFGSGTLCAAPQGPDTDRPAGGPPPGMQGDMGAQRPQMQAPRSGMPDREVLKKAGATEAQVQALTDADFNLRDKQIDLRAKAEKAELALERQMASTNVDEKAVMAAADAMSQARGDLFKLELAMELKRKQILGDELMRKLHEMRPPERPASPMPMPGIAGPGSANGPQEMGNRQPRGNRGLHAEPQDAGPRAMPPPPGAGN